MSSETSYGSFPSRFHKWRIERAAVLLARHLAACDQDVHEYSIGDNVNDVRITVKWELRSCEKPN